MNQVTDSKDKRKLAQLESTIKTYEAELAALSLKRKSIENLIQRSSDLKRIKISGSSSTARAQPTTLKLTNFFMKRPKDDQPSSNNVLPLNGPTEPTAAQSTNEETVSPPPPIENPGSNGVLTIFMSSFLFTC
jgi:hypothetical protein